MRLQEYEISTVKRLEEEWNKRHRERESKGIKGYMNDKNEICVIAIDEKGRFYPKISSWSEELKKKFYDKYKYKNHTNEPKINFKGIIDPHPIYGEFLYPRGKKSFLKTKYGIKTTNIFGTTTGNIPNISLIMSDLSKNPGKVSDAFLFGYDENNLPSFIFRGPKYKNIIEQIEYSLVPKSEIVKYLGNGLFHIFIIAPSIIGGILGVVGFDIYISMLIENLSNEFKGYIRIGLLILLIVILYKNRPENKENNRNKTKVNILFKIFLILLGFLGYFVFISAIR
ncbi:MAG: hypothetical protein FWF57_05195 [Defluviitaleaceae bacterium]|nr:hypothetical protein [Defluviitaleaceae bacterium]